MTNEDMKSDRPTDASLHDDAGVAAMLTEAFDAPPVPRSLTKRLEDGIVAQWGRSPELIPAREGAVHVAKSAASRGVAILRSWPVAAGLAASVALAFFFFSGGNNSVWASMIEAIKHRGIIQVVDDSQARWLDLRRQAIGSQTSERVKLIDVGNQRVMLRRPTDSETLYQAELKEAPSVDSNSLVAAFLMSEPLSARSLTSLRDLSVVNESLHWRQMEGRQVAELRVRLQGADREPFSVRVAIDADTHLPIGLQAQAGTQPVKLEFLDSAGESPSQRFFPNELKVVDLALEEPNEPIELVADRAIAALASETSQLAATEDTPREQQSTRTSTLPEGAANEWLPVARVSRTGEEVVDRINDLVEKLWQRENVQPVGAASDLQLLRRAYLDLVGRAPTVAEVRNYIKADAKDRYELLVDRLLESPDHASALAAVWRSFLIPEGVDLDAFGGREAFDQWLAERFEADEPYDELVRKLLLAEGRVTQSGPLLFYTALKLDADQLAARTSRAFLGMRLECAQCHDHPFEPWSQEDFWSYAAFFARISRPKGELENVSTVMRVHDIDRGEVMLPETETVVAPRFLGGNVSLQDSDVERSEGNERTDRRAQLAQWLTGADNPYFARATVNRLWSHCFGRGIVDPVDDFGSNNEPVSPELLDTLASQLIESRFNLKPSHSVDRPLGCLSPE